MKVHRDLYEFNPSEIEPPPHGLWRTLARIGPGMILAASIVGSGELIATTTLGAEVGYVALWVILFSCFVKPALQAEVGRYSVITGQTGLEAMNQIPGPRWRVGWVVWAWVVMVVATMAQIGAMFGGAAQVFHLLMPAVPINAWVLVLLSITLALLLGGGYERIEKLATIKVCLFTMLTFLCAIILTRNSNLFAWSDVLGGLKLTLPANGLMTAVAVFGITGVGATEIFMYPYWCVEKGYARRVGRNDGSSAWTARARGWIRVMYVDILSSMGIYTVATVAFYLLGAGILHPQGLVPSAKDMIPILSRIYTETLGPWGLGLFYLGATVTLYGTIFAATAAHSRVFADLCHLFGLFPRGDYETRLRYRNRFVVLLTVIPAMLYLFFQSPVTMVKVGGLAQAAMLPIIAGATLYIRHYLSAGEARPHPLTTVGLWVSASLTIFLMGLSIFFSSH